jgi:hypothetical protein
MGNKVLTLKLTVPDKGQVVLKVVDSTTSRDGGVTHVEQDKPDPDEWSNVASAGDAARRAIEGFIERASKDAKPGLLFEKDSDVALPTDPPRKKKANRGKR